MPKKERLLPDVSELPSEVLRVIGTENLRLDDPIVHNAILAGLTMDYQRHGLEWIKENRDYVIEKIRELDMF